MAGISCSCLSCQIKSHKEERNCPCVVCCRGELGDKTWRHLAVKLSISLFSSFLFSPQLFSLRCEAKVYGSPYLTAAAAQTFLVSHLLQKSPKHPGAHSRHLMQTHAGSTQKCLPAGVSIPARRQPARSQPKARDSFNTVYILQTVHGICALLCEGSSSPFSQLSLFYWLEMTNDLPSTSGLFSSIRRHSSFTRTCSHAQMNPPTRCHVDIAAGDF